MISTGIDKRVQIQQIVDNQLPQFVLSESPKAADFLKQYYISQEYSGGPIDITDNLDQYLKLDNLTPDVIVGKTTLDVSITSDDKTISVNSTKGFPNEYGLLKIDDEIITYTGSTATSFTGCIRGFSGITTYHDDNNAGELIFSDTTASSHDATSEITNLSVLFLKEFSKKLKYSLTPGLENVDFVSDLDVGNFIKEAKSFYQSKGTEESFRILFNVLYGYEPKIIDLEQYVIKPSSAKYIRRDRIVAEKIKGNPLNLKGQTIIRSTDSTTTASLSEVQPVLGISGTGISTSTDYYILDAFIGYNDEEFITGTFDVTGKTKVIGDVPIDSSVITVDSTIGFGNTGTIISGINTNITYTDKTINQFLGVTGIVAPIPSQDSIRDDDYIFGYENGDLSKKVELRITGILSKFVPDSNNRLSIENESVIVKSIGEKIGSSEFTSNKSIFANSWRYNTSITYQVDEFFWKDVTLDDSDVTEDDLDLIIKYDSNGSIIGRFYRTSEFRMSETLSKKFDLVGLSEGDSVEIVERSSNPFKSKKVITSADENIIVTTISKIIIGNNIERSKIQVTDGPYDLDIAKKYDVRKVLTKTSSSGVPIKYGNDKLTSDVQNVYNDSDENLYVASNCLPPYEIQKNIATIGITTTNTDTLQGYNPITEKYSVISFTTPVPFITGDSVYYKPDNTNNPLVGLDEGIYYVKNISGFNNKINLYLSPSFIASDENLSTPNNFIEFGIPTVSEGHTFTLLKHYNKQVESQNLLKKYPINPSLKTGEKEKTIPGSVGMLIDGVEIINYKSDDNIFYGPLDKFSVLSQGTGYDVINPPQIDISSGIGSTALVRPVVTGKLEEILVDPQDFDIENVLSVKITGANSKNISLEPILKRVNRELKFDGRLRTANGGVDNQAETIDFGRKHNLKNGQVLIYDRNDNEPLGITTWGGSNADAYQSLTQGESYWPEVVGLTTIRLFGNEDDYNSGINTIAFTSIRKSGIHKFKLKNSKNSLKTVKVVKTSDADNSFTNREIYVRPSGISIHDSIITFENHGFSEGEVVNYTTIPGIGVTNPTTISGLSTSTQYKIIKLNDNSFRLADVGIGNTVDTNYISNTYARLNSVGTGYQVFKYPDIEITSEITYSVATSEKVVFTPVIKGQISDAILYEKGSDYGAQTVINYENKPNITLKNGIGRAEKNIQPSLVPILNNGRIVSVNIQNGGAEYYSVPNVDIKGDGTGAKLRPIIDNDPNSKTYLSIIDVKILNGGIGFSTSNTSIKVTPSGSNVVFDLNIRKLPINNIQTLENFNIRYTSEVLQDSVYGLKYSTVGYSTAIGLKYFNDPNPITGHSPIIGWAYDGNPIYGPYGYSDPTNTNEIKVLQSSYVLNSSNIDNRPGITKFGEGFFTDDYVYDPSVGDLDEHNGRYCKTPEYPNGVYAYFASVNDNVGGEKLPKFPYFIGNTYRSNAAVVDSESKITQSFDFNNSNLIRNTTPYRISEEFSGNDFIIESDRFINQETNVESVTRGNVDELIITNSGDNYKIGDTLVFDESNSDGSGLNANVSLVEGKPITNIETVYEEYQNVKLVWDNSNQVSAYISTYHDLIGANHIQISGISTDIANLNKSHVIGVSSESTVLYSAVGTGVAVTDIVVGKTSDLISVGSSIGIGTEILSVLNKFEDRNILRCERGLTGTAHTISSLVKLLPNSFILPVETDYFDSELDNIVYFNPKQSVGKESISGLSTSITVTLAGIDRTISIPAQSIYLPNHGFKTGDRLIFKEPSNTGFANIGVSTNGIPGSGSPTSIGHDDIVYAINKSKDFIGIVTDPSVIGSGDTSGKSSGLFFVGDGDDSFKYSFRKQNNQVTATAERITSTVSVSTSHGLQKNDNINLIIKPSKDIGIGNSTAIKVKYNSIKDKLLINPIGFNSTGVDTTTNILTINSHGYKTGDKVFYDNTDDDIIGGLSTTGYFVYRVDDDKIKLSNTYYDSNITPPKVVSLTSIGGTSHELSLINPPINVVRDNDLIFDVSDSSLSGYNFNLYYDENYINNFVSTGQTNRYSVAIGTAPGNVGAAITLNYSTNNPLSLFYSLEKGGFISTSDIDVINKSKISYIDSEYVGNYSVVETTDTSFKVVIKDKPEVLGYAATSIGVGGTITYNTSSTSALGPINSIKINYRGEGYRQLPRFVSVASTQGFNANILPRSSTANKISNTNILNVGFEYSSDKTLLPIAKVSPVTSLKNYDFITGVDIIDGGSGYQSNPKLIVVDTETGEINDNGALEAIVSPSTQSIEDVNILANPKGIGNAEIYAIDGTNGIPITTINMNSGIINDAVSGIVTVRLGTPVLGFSEVPFVVGDRVFIEGVQNIDDGNTLNSPSNRYQTYPVTAVTSSNPFTMKINLNGIITEPGIAKTDQTFAQVINSKNYPRFKITQEPGFFIEGEKILVKIDDVFLDKKLTLDKIGNDYVKIQGKYDLKEGDRIKGESSGAIGNINTLYENKGSFIVDFSSKKNQGWLDNVGKLDQDYQVLPDNDYYQNLSYTIQSPIQYKDLVTPVNRLVHTAGLKNFADVGITSSVISGLTTSIDTTTVVRDLLSNNRVDAISNFDLVKDIDFLSNPLRTKFIQFKTKELVNYFKCKTNRVLEIDNINTLFGDSSNNAKLDGTVALTDNYNRFLVQSRNPINSDIQVTELVTSIDFVKEDVYTIQKGSIGDDLVEIIGDKVLNGQYQLKFNPKNNFDVDLDIKIYQNSFDVSSTGIGTTNFGFVELTSTGQNVATATTHTLTSANISNIDSYFASVEIRDTFTNEIQIVDLYVTHDGTNSYISNYEFNPNNSSGIGSFSSKIDSNILSIDYTNDRSNEVSLLSKIVGFGATTSGIGTYRFKSDIQPDGSEETLRIESSFTNVSAGATTTISQFSKSKDSSVKSIIRTSIGNTSSIHQLLLTHDGTDTILTEYGFVSIDSNLGIGTFSSKYNGSNIDLVFTPNSDFSSDPVEVQVFNEVINTNIDLINEPSILTYGKSIDSLSLLQFVGTNSVSANIKAFRLNYNNTPIFGKYFNPGDSTKLKLGTGSFYIEDHFFSNNEKVNYTPGSSIQGVGISSLIMSNGSALPRDLYVLRENENEFKLSATKAGAAITFNSSGTGNYHRLEMDKKNEKSLIVLNDIIQSPLAYTPISHTLNNNVSGSVSISTSVISLSGISTILIDDILNVGDEYMTVRNVGVGTTNVGPIGFEGSLNLVEVERGSVGTSATTHSDGAAIRLYKGGYNIIGDTLYFTNAPRGNNETAKSESNRDTGKSNFSGRVYLRQDYSSNMILDDISNKFTGIDKKFVVTSNGINTVGLSTGSTLMSINGFFQKPTTDNNLGNNYFFEADTSAGITTVVFTGITSYNGTQIISESDINQNQLPRAGQIISIASTGGLGIAPLVGAAVTAVIGAGKSIVSVGLGTTDFNGSGYSSGLSTTGNGLISIGITDAGYDHRFVSSGVNSVTVSANGIGANATFTPTDASYTSHTGVLVLTKQNHGLLTSDSHKAITGTQYNATVGIMTVKLAASPSPALANGQLVKIDNLGVKFTCDKDAHATEHDYPRENDPLSGKWVPISNVTGGDTFEITVLDTIPSSNTGIHTFVSGATNAIKRSANTLSIANDSLVFNCSLDGYQANKAYPRAGIDPIAGVSTTILEATSNTVTVNIGAGGGAGIGASIRASVGIGGTLTFEVVEGGSGYVNPIIMPPSPSYENIEVIGVSRLGLGATTDTGKSLLVSIDVGPTSTTGIGSTLYEVKSFEFTRKGYGFKKGDVFRPLFGGEDINKVGLVTDVGLSSPLSNLEFTVNSTFTDQFSLWNVGEFDYIDSIKSLQNGVRTRFPMNFNGELVAFQVDSNDVDSQLIDIRSLLLIFVNGVLQVPGEAYFYDGGTTFTFSEPPDENDDVGIFFYKGTNNVDVVYTDIIETLKVGDDVQILKNESFINNDGIQVGILDQEPRTIVGITTSDTIETNLYYDIGINDEVDRPLTWIKQKIDKVINGNIVYKSRPSIEPLVFPEARIIGDLSASDTEVFVDNLSLFNYEKETPLSIDSIIFPYSENLVGAAITAIVSAAGTISSLNIVSGGSGYVGATTSISVGVPTTGIIANTATATASITAGIITSIAITNPGVGYTRSNPPKVIVATPKGSNEIITGIAATAGFSGIITGITTTTGTGGNSLALKFFAKIGDGTFSGLNNGYPIYIYDTSVGSGVTSIDEGGNSAVVGIGTTYLDNIYYVRSLTSVGTNGEFVVNVDSGSNIVGIATTGTCGKFTWGRLSNFSRGSNPISIGVTSKTISGLSTFPTIQRRNAGFRNTGGINNPT